MGYETLYDRIQTRAIDWQEALHTFHGQYEENDSDDFVKMGQAIAFQIPGRRQNPLLQPKWARVLREVVEDKDADASDWKKASDVLFKEAWRYEKLSPDNNPFMDETVAIATTHHGPVMRIVALMELLPLAIIDEIFGDYRLSEADNATDNLKEDPLSVKTKYHLGEFVDYVEGIIDTIGMRAKEIAESRSHLQAIRKIVETC